MPPDGFHEVRRHIRRNPRPRGKKLGFWTIAGIAAFVWLWGQVIGFDTSSSGAETDRPASPSPSVSASSSR